MTAARLSVLAIVASACFLFSARSPAGTNSLEEPPPSSAADAAEIEPPIRFRVIIDAPRSHAKQLEEGLDLMRWHKAERVTMPLLERLVAEARRAAAEALSADGYFSPKVDSKIERKGDEAVVRLTVDLGPRTRVRSVDLEVTGAAAKDPEGRRRIEVVRQTWGMPPGEPFRDSEWNAAKDAALGRLARGRYAAAKLAESEARVVPDEQAAYLTLKLDSGPIFHAGAVNVSGLTRYPPDVVRNFNPHARGEPYDATKLAQYQRRLLETGYFNAVNFAIDPDPDQSAAAALNVQVIEAPSQRIDTGISYSTDVGLGFKADYGNADIFRSAWRFRSILDANQKEQKLTTSFDSPPRPGGTWSTYSGRMERSDVEGLLSREAVVSYAHSWGLEHVPSQASVSAHFERQTISGSTKENNHAVFVAYRKTFRTTEEIVTPRKGFIGTAEGGVSVPGLSSQRFARVRGLVNWLIPLGLRNDLLLRGEAGAVIAESRLGIPSSFLFRTGGDETVRGYSLESIGVPQAQAIVGGRYLSVASVEFTRWIADTLGAAAFIDAGDAFDDFDAFDVAVGYGIGVRWKSPIGPFRGDIAYGERSKKVRLHFSVGYSF